MEYIKKDRPLPDEEKQKEEISQEVSPVPPIEQIVKKLDQDTVLIKDVPYTIVENYREALDVDELNKRYSPVLEKYDYIVGDISDSKARLKGFYRSSYKKAPEELRISRLEDYLLEYCNFGCAYYVLQRADGKKAMISGTKKPRTRKSPAPKKGNWEPDKGSKKTASASKTNRKETENKRKPARSFETREIKKNDRTDQPQTSRVETVKDNKGKARFHIRKTNTGEQNSK